MYFCFLSYYYWVCVLLPCFYSWRVEEPWRLLDNCERRQLTIKLYDKLYIRASCAENATFSKLLTAWVQMNLMIPLWQLLLCRLHGFTLWNSATVFYSILLSQTFCLPAVYVIWIDCQQVHLPLTAGVQRGCLLSLCQGCLRVWMLSFLLLPYQQGHICSGAAANSLSLDQQHIVWFC